MSKSVMDMVAEAKAAVPAVDPDELKDLMEQGDVLVVDVRDGAEVEKSGKVPGAVHVSRGMLEFRADEKSPYHLDAFNKDKTVVLYCASGGRAVLAGKTLQDLGFKDVRTLGSLEAWTNGGGDVER